MSQKVNSKNQRIGVNINWPIKIQKYGKSFCKTIKLFYEYKKGWTLVFNLFKLEKMFIDNIELKHYNSNVILNIFILIKYNKLKVKKIFINWFHWLYSNKNLKIYIYTNKNKIYTSNILWFYINYLNNNLKYNTKKILAILTLLLKKKLNSKVIIFTKVGPTFLVLKGYKIQLKGRLDNQKSQMSKKTTFKKGSINLTKLNNYVDFKNIQIYTKLGNCNFKVWLFYKII